MKKLFLVLIIAFVTTNVKSFAEEGMWTFNNIPTKEIKEKYGFDVTKEWLDHVRLSSVRFMDGGSGSFVSPSGLVITNHHVGVGQIQKLSTPEHDYVKNGFRAKNQSEELKCPDLELNVLVNLTDVTSQVKEAIKPNMNKQEMLDAKQKAIDKIEKENFEKSGLRSDVVSFYNGAEYWLLQYKKYTDVRLVFAPERQMAYFGGDYDNFTYPRYDLDFSLFRIYENDKPLQTQNYLKFNTEGLSENDLVFMSGNPGHTDRLKTLAQLKFSRDISISLRLQSIQNMLETLQKYASQGEEQARRALMYQFGLENSKKALTGQLNGLKDPELLSIKEKEENDFKEKIKENPEYAKKYLPAFEQIEKLLEQYKDYSVKQNYRNFGSRLFGYALSIVRFIEQSKKKPEDRLPGYNDASLPGMKFRLLSPAPIYKDLDKALAWGNVKYGIGHIGIEDEYWRLIFEGMDPKTTVSDLIDKTKLDNVDYRKTLIEGGVAELSKSDDPMIKLAMKINPYLEKQEKEYRDNFESILDEAQEKIAEARFLIYGHNKYPDANFTLRLTYGQVKGYPMNGTIAPPFTTLYGLFDRSLGFGNKGDFELAPRYWERKNNLDLSTPCNFVSTCDIIGGNSGSPTINKNGEFVGIVFDGNIESLPGSFVYDGRNNRAVSLHAKYIITALRNLYDANNIANELEDKK
jgi:hypothetical protein